MQEPPHLGDSDDDSPTTTQRQPPTAEESTTKKPFNMFGAGGNAEEGPKNVLGASFVGLCFLQFAKFGAKRTSGPRAGIGKICCTVGAIALLAYGKGRIGEAAVPGPPLPTATTATTHSLYPQPLPTATTATALPTATALDSTFFDDLDDYLDLPGLAHDEPEPDEPAFALPDDGGSAPDPLPPPPLPSGGDAVPSLSAIAQRAAQALQQAAARRSSAPPPDFLQAAKFQGAKSGYFFKLGAKGLGYYADLAVPSGPRPTDTVEAQESPPLRCFEQLGLSLPQCSRDLWSSLDRDYFQTELPCSSLTLLPAPSEPPSASGHPVDLATPARRPGHTSATRKKRAAARAAAPPIQEQRDKLPPFTDIATVDGAGYTFSIDSYNTTGWSAACAVLDKSAADALCLQEIKRQPGPQSEAAEDTARAKKWSMTVGPSTETEAGHLSAGVAVAARSHFGLGKSRLAPAEDLDAARFKSAWFPSLVRGGVHLISLYLVSGESITSARNRKLLEAVAQLIDNLDGPFILAGDLQNDPDRLAESGWPEKVGGKIRASAHPTCGANRLDYFVVSECLDDFVIGVQCINDSGTKPHVGTRLLVRHGARNTLQRKLKAPLTLRVLPFGPRNDIVHVLPPVTDRSRIGLNAAAQNLWAAVECEAIHLYAEDTEVTDRYRGRGEQHGTVWRCAAGAPGSSFSNQSHGSRRWRLVCGWLTDLLRLARFQANFTDSARHESWKGTVGKILHARRWRNLLPSELTRSKLALPDVAAIPQVAQWLRGITHVDLLDSVKVRLRLVDANAFAAAFQRADCCANAVGWASWLADGIAKGGRNVHRWSRGPKGWIAAPVISTCDDDTCIELGGQQIPTATAAPASQQQLVDDQSQKWSLQWGCNLDIAPTLFPVITSFAAPMTVDELLDGGRSLPLGTALGTDTYHPRIFERMPMPILLALIELFILCEELGYFPDNVGDVIIALLDKTDGGLRPIGIFPSFVRHWMRIRARHPKKWEADNERSFFFAGKKKGADVALWLQTGSLEQAALSSNMSAASLIDLVKCFERVSHQVLVDEAVECTYPLWHVRLTLAAYALGRRIAINGVLAAVVRALRGLTAGSSTATTELRLVLLRALDFVSRTCKSITMQVYVDDMFQFAAGGMQHVLTGLSSATITLIRRLIALKFEVSTTKSLGIASSEKLALALNDRLADYDITYSSHAKSLGGDLVAGNSRKVPVQRGRIDALVQKSARLQVLRQSGVNMANLFRSGLSSAVHWGMHAMGIASTPLQRWRSTTARGCAAAARGKSVDIVLFLADRRPRDATDPAFAAHELPMGYWATAIWERWQEPDTFIAWFVDARDKLAKAKCVWSAVTGPATATLATLARIRWVAHSAIDWDDDLGTRWTLNRDAPLAVKAAVRESVRRWQVRRIQAIFPSAGLERGIFSQPLFSALAQFSTKADSSWGSSQQSMLLSSTCNGQWTEDRLFKAGLAPTDLCQLCLAAKGTLAHRVWFCKHPRLLDARCKHVPLAIIEEAQHACRWGNLAPWTRGLFPMPAEFPFDTRHESFEWILRPPDDVVAGTVYPDGSKVGTKIELTSGLGWAFAACDSDDQVTAIARGTPPHWARSVYGCELWSLTQAAVHTVAPSAYRQDCKSVVDTARHITSNVGATASRYARAWNIFRAAVDHTPCAGTDDDVDILWIPAHTAAGDSRISHADRRGNDVADKHAKLAAEGQRPPVATLRSVAAYAKKVATVVRWIGIAGDLANQRDSRDASACQAQSRRRKENAAVNAACRTAKGTKANTPVPARPLQLGGHSLTKGTDTWRCSVCRCSSSSWNAIASRSCAGSAVRKWAARAASDQFKDVRHSPDHTIWLSDDTLWCSTCGLSSTHSAVGLKLACEPRKAGNTTTWTRLMRGTHPITKVPFDCQPIPQHAWQIMPDAPPCPQPASLDQAVLRPRPSTAAAKKLRTRTVKATTPAAPCHSSASSEPRAVSALPFQPKPETAAVREQRSALLAKAAALSHSASSTDPAPPLQSRISPTAVDWLSYCSVPPAPSTPTPASPLHRARAGATPASSRVTSSGLLPSAVAARPGARAGSTPASSCRSSASSVAVIAAVQPRARTGTTPVSSSLSPAAAAIAAVAARIRARPGASPASSNGPARRPDPTSNQPNNSTADAAHSHFPRPTSIVLGEFAAFDRQRVTLAPPTARPRRRSAPHRQQPPQPSPSPTPAPPQLPRQPSPHTPSPAQRGQSELDNVVLALDNLLARPPDHLFDATLQLLNDRIDAVGPGVAATSSSHSQAKRPTPRAAARARPRPTSSLDFEPMQFDTVRWRARLLEPAQAHAPRRLPLDTDPPLPTPPHSSLSDDQLRDLIDMHQDGLRVQWPDGLDVNVARVVLKARKELLDSDRRTNHHAPTNILRANELYSSPAEPCGVPLGRPPGVYSPRVSPDGATREVHTRRTSVETSSAFTGESNCTVTSISSEPASTMQELSGSFPNTVLAEPPPFSDQLGELPLRRV